MKKRLKIEWLITCIDKAQTDKAKAEAKERTKLDRVYKDIAIAFPGGVKKERIEEHNFAEYFEQIDVTDVDDLCFKITYYLKPDTKNYWKDLVVETLAVLRNLYGASAKKVPDQLHEHYVDVPSGLTKYSKKLIEEGKKYYGKLIFKGKETDEPT